MTNPNPYAAPEATAPTAGAGSASKVMASLAGCLIPPLFLVLCCGGLVWFCGGHELLHEFQLTRGSVRIYAEGIFSEPPGYIYFEIRENGRVTVPERSFMGIGIEHKPSTPFRVIESADGNVFAIVLEDDIKMMHEFSTRSTWPGEYTNVGEVEYQLGERLWASLREKHPSVQCTRQVEFLWRQQRASTVSNPQP